jgi:2,4-dienoyl-CoA reductase-like NADH-dependent reductase (Old Yellow Enzyme family)
MKRMFEAYNLGVLKLTNRFVFPPIKTAFGTPKGNVTDRRIVECHHPAPYSR